MMKKDGSLYYASDKALYDALRQSAFKKTDLREIFLSRGIIFSDSSERTDLALYFSRLNHDYYDHQAISKSFNSVQRKEKVALTCVENKVCTESLEKSVAAFIDKAVEKGDEATYVATTKGFDVTFRYTQIDYNKTEFKQIVEKEALISIEKDEEGFVIRSPQNDYVEEVKELVVDCIADEVDEDLSFDNVELRGVEDPSLRSDFFCKLTELIDGASCHDVTDVYVYHPKFRQESDADNFDEDSDEDFGVHITKATLKGEGVLKSEELHSLYAKGFYIWKIVWIANEGATDGNRYIIEAQFADPENCQKFSYLLKGVLKLKDKGGYYSNSRALTSLEERKYSRLVEKAARESMDRVVSGIAGEVDCNESESL
jgi:hypothetical protein